MRLVNFGEETVNKLKYYNYTVEDIAWIGNHFIEIPIHEFFDAARNTTYNAGYGSAAMPIDLLIVMKDGAYFERAEYDGSEWWRYVAIIERPRLRTHLKYKNFVNKPLYDDPVLGNFIIERK